MLIVAITEANCYNCLQGREINCFQKVVNILQQQILQVYNWLFLEHDTRSLELSNSLLPKLSDTQTL